MINPAVLPAWGSTRFERLHAQNLENLRFSLAGSLSMLHVTTACSRTTRDALRDDRFDVTLSDVMRCTCADFADFFYPNRGTCTSLMVRPYTARRAQNLALTVNSGEVLNVTGDLCKRGVMKDGRCLSSTCLARLSAEDMPACPSN